MHASVGVSEGGGATLSEFFIRDAIVKRRKQAQEEIEGTRGFLSVGQINS